MAEVRHPLQSGTVGVTKQESGATAARVPVGLAKDVALPHDLVSKLDARTRRADVQDGRYCIGRCFNAE
jgi:hypothetical protein